MSGPVLVTGAGGNVGGAVVQALTAAGIPVRAGGTNLEALRSRYPAAETTRLDFLDPTSFSSALDGCTGVFLLRPPPIARVGPTLNALLDVAERHEQVQHVVFSSVTGADTNRIVPHHRVEKHLTSSRLSWTILRPGFFAQNLADAYRTDIVEDDRIYLPAGSGRAAFIDVRDIGQAAAVVFTDPAPHRGIGYTLTGPQALDFHRVAAILSEQLGRPIAYHPASIGGYVRHLHRRGLPLSQVLVQTVLHTGLRRGQAETVDPTLARLLSTTPRTLEQYVHDHARTWARPQAPGR